MPKTPLTSAPILDGKRATATPTKFKDSTSTKKNNKLSDEYKQDELIICVKNLTEAIITNTIAVDNNSAHVGKIDFHTKFAARKKQLFSNNSNDSGISIALTGSDIISQSKSEESYEEPEFATKNQVIEAHYPFQTSPLSKTFTTFNNTILPPTHHRTQVSYAKTLYETAKKKNILNKLPKEIQKTQGKAKNFQTFLKGDMTPFISTMVEIVNKSPSKAPSTPIKKK